MAAKAMAATAAAAAARDRYRRERREEGQVQDGGFDSNAAEAAPPQPAAPDALAAAPLEPSSVEPQPHPQIVVAAAAPIAVPAPVVAAVVAVPTFVLPLANLHSVAETAGLQWVNSDADKVRATQQAIAAEPKPLHVPRERSPLLSIDDGPLVLVETRKDLGQIKLPFEQQG